MSRDLWLRSAHLAALWALGFAQPLFEILSDSPEFFVARGNTRGDILALALGLVLIPPALMLLAEWAASRASPRFGLGVHLIFLGALVAALALQLLDGVLAISDGALVAVAAAAGAAAAAAYARTRFVPAVLTVLTPAPVLFVVLFLFFSPVRELILPQTQAEAIEAEVRSDVPVVMVVFDEFPTTSLMDRRGEIDATRYPSFAAFARQATWYRNATTVSDFTNRAVPGILTGSDPGDEALPTSADQPENLFTLLGGNYRLEVLEDLTNLCPPSLCARRSGEPFDDRMRSLSSDLAVVSGHLVLPATYRDDLPPIDTTFGDFAAGGLDAPTEAQEELTEALGPSFFTGRPARFQRFIDSIGGSHRTLYFLHVQLPHQPWQYLPSGKGYPTGDPSLQNFVGDHGQWSDQRWLVEHSYQRHLLQVGYVDRVLGKMIRRLRSEGIWNRAVVVLAADHGISFRPGIYRREVIDENVGGVAGVPLFVKAPGQRHGRIDDRPAYTVDVLPTVADHLGIEVPFDTEGESLIGDAADSGIEGAEIAVADRYGDGPVLPLEEFVGLRDRIVARKLRLFGSGGWGPVYRFGPHAELIGRRAPPSPPPPDAPRFALADAELYESVDSESLAVPALVRGELTGGVERDEPLAVAVNGRIAAVGRSYLSGEGTYLSILVPPSALRPGANEIQVLRVFEEDGEARLVPLADSDD